MGGAGQGFANRYRRTGGGLFVIRGSCFPRTCDCTDHRNHVRREVRERFGRLVERFTPETPRTLFLGGLGRVKMGNLGEACDLDTILITPLVMAHAHTRDDHASNDKTANRPRVIVAG